MLIAPMSIPSPLYIKLGILSIFSEFKDEFSLKGYIKH